MKSDYEKAILIEDSSGDENKDNTPICKKIQPLKKYYHEDNVFEVGVDEVGRGPLFGRVYTAAVILSKDDSFDHSKMKDSKKFHSKKKIEEVAEYIKKNALAWSVTFEDEKVIDDINILQATQKSMHKSIQQTIKINYLNHRNKHDYHLLIDGNYFKPMIMDSQYINKYEVTCVEKGDNKYSAIAAASILAKVERDKYITDLCLENPDLSEKYGIDSNKGYGAKKHLEGIKKHGITIWHRRTFGTCKNYV
jgi:ribonuclease HII